MLQKIRVKDKVSFISYLIIYGVLVPHFCYHINLSIDGSCRICIVELENSPKPVMPCATKTTLNNNNLFIESVLLKKARKNALEFLLLNHLLDCPICDQGSGCDLATLIG